MPTSNYFDPLFLLKNASSPTAIVDKNLRYINVSDSWEEHHGITEEIAIGKTIFELFPTINIQWRQVFDDSIKGNKNVKEDTVLVKNEKRRIQWSIIPWLDDNKVIGGLVIRLEDVTEKKKLEDELKESNERFKSAFTFSCIGMAIVSVEGKCLQVNAELCNMLGYTESELLELTFQDFTHPADLAEDVAKLQELKDGKINFYNLEKRYYHKEGHIIWVYLAISMVKDKKGRPLHFVSQIIDRTAARKVEDEIKTSRAELQKIMDESLDIICYLNYDGQVLQINKACKEIWGYEPEELIGTILPKLVIEEDIKKTLEASEYVKKGNNLRHFENRYRKKDGSIVPMIWSIRANSTDETIFAIVQDASDKKRTEEKLQELNFQLEKRAAELAVSNQYLEEFAFVASHDLQEPLRMISSFLDLLKLKYDSLLDDTAKKYIYFAVDGASRMQKMIHGLLEYSMLGNATSDFQEIDMNQLLKEAIDLNKFNINKKEAILNWPQMPTIIGIKASLLQLFHNLLSNALKYQTEGNRPIIDINVEDQANTWIFSVKDNGIGIDKKYSQKIFNLFQRLHNKQQYSGSGIGLSICKRIVENHKGKMWVESEIGIGCTIYFTISKNLH